MNSVITATAVYGLLLLILRLTGKRTLGEMTTFDLILVLIISEAVQQALIGKDLSFTNAALIIVTLVFLDIVISLVKQHVAPAEKLLESSPLILVDHGRALHARMDRARVSEDDVLEAARVLRGLERMEQIKYAVLERKGNISIIPFAESAEGDDR